MRKEGTGKLQNPDIALDADVRMRELHFERAPEPEVRFWGNTERSSLWESKRENLPDEVQEDVVYRNVRVRLRIASEVVNSDPDIWDNLNKERTQANLEYSRREVGEQEPESREEKK